MSSMATIYIYSNDGEVTSMASGFLYKISKTDGLVGTNYHVIASLQRDDKMMVRYNNGKVVRGQVYSYDKNSDLAMISANTELSEAPKIEFKENADGIKIGDELYAIGSPVNLTNTVSNGVLSGTHRASLYFPKEMSDGEKDAVVRSGKIDTSNIAIIDAMQTDASITNGSSGGIIFDKSCKAIGVVFGGRQNPMNGDVIPGLNFFIPPYILSYVLPALENKSIVQHGSIGLVIGSSSSFLAILASEKRETLKSNGALIEAVQNEELKKNNTIIDGDVVVSYNGEIVNDQYQLLSFIFSSKPGDKVTLGYYRNTNGIQYMESTVTITAGMHDIASELTSSSL
jgi:S1-C subfamily serine protease